MTPPAPSILLVNRIYPPDKGATGQLVSDLAGRLAGRGWQVTVLTTRSGMPEPDHSGQDTGTTQEEATDGIRVVRVGAGAVRKGRHWRRALDYLAMYPRFLVRGLLLPRHDVVVTLTDPPMLLLLGLVLRWLKGSRAVHWAQDIYPELAERLGVIRDGGLLARVLRRVSTLALKLQDAIVAIGFCMKSVLIERGLTPERIAVVPNWGQDLPYVPSSSRSANPFVSRHQLQDRFVVMYSGNLGMAHTFDPILGAARKLQETKPKLQFVFVGDGRGIQTVQERVTELGLCNVLFLPPQPRDTLVHSLTAAHVHLASMKSDLMGLVVPSKVYGILSAGRPCVFLGPKQSDAAQVLRQFDCGSILAETDTEGLVEQLVYWMDHPERREEAEVNAYQASRAFQADEAAIQFQDLLEALVKNEAVWTAPAPGSALASSPGSPVSPR